MAVPAVVVVARVDSAVDGVTDVVVTESVAVAVVDVAVAVGAVVRVRVSVETDV